jgi:hypothetical protein
MPDPTLSPILEHRVDLILHSWWASAPWPSHSTSYPAPRTRVLIIQLLTAMPQLPCSPVLDVTLSLLVPRVRRANDIEIAIAPFVGFPADDLAMLAPLLDSAVYLHPPRLLPLNSRNLALSSGLTPHSKRWPRAAWTVAFVLARKNSLRERSCLLGGRSRLCLRCRRRGEGEGAHRRGESASCGARSQGLREER